MLEVAVVDVITVPEELVVAAVSSGSGSGGSSSQRLSVAVSGCQWQQRQQN